MSKAKRGKSASASEVVCWEKDLAQACFEEDDWKAMVAFIQPQHTTDRDIVNLLAETIATGTRKLFTVVEYGKLLHEAKELAVQSKGNKAKPIGKHPQFMEVCDFVKSVIDKGEKLSTSMLARLIKFKLLMVKTKDQERRADEKKAQGSSPKSNLENSRSQSKSSPRKSVSPSKGKKGKKEDRPPSAKKDTKLKKRGEESDEIKTVDDEPDGENDPKHYIILSGFTDASLLSFLIDMKIHVESIISIKTEYHIKLLKDSKSEEANNIDEIADLSTDEKIEEFEYQEKLDNFWKESNILMKYAPAGHALLDVAKFDVIVKEDCLPSQLLKFVDQEKKMEFGGWLFDKVADVCYDVLDYLEQYQNYTKNLKVLNVSAIPERKQSAVGIADSQSGSAVPDDSAASMKPPPTDLSYYNHLMSHVPIDYESIPLIMDCLLEQVVALTDGPNPMEHPRTPREDNINHLIGDYMDRRLKAMGLVEEKVKKPTPIKPKSPKIIYSSDKQRYGALNVKQNKFFDVLEVEDKMRNFYPYSNFVRYLQPVSDEWVKNCARRQQLYNICSENAVISLEKFERAMRQYIFESLPIEPVDSGGVEQDLVDQQIEKIASCWDDPYHDMQQMYSAPSVDKTTSKEEKNITLRKLDQYCWLEHFEPSILFQILDDGNEMRPFLDTYYNRGNNTLLVIMYNPCNENLQNTYSWASWLHSDVGFKNYLEHVAIQIDEWTQEQEHLQEEKRNSEKPKNEPPPSTPPPPVKERSRWGMQTRAEIQAAKAQTLEKDKRKKSAKSRSASPRKAGASKSPEKSVKSRRPSAKSKSRVGTATNRPQSGKSNVSFQEDDLKEKLMTHTYAFTGYNLGDSLLHVNGDQSYLFPDGKGLIKIEKTRFIQGNLCVQVSVMMRGHTFCVNLANPVDEDALDEVVEQVKEANSNECDMVNKIPSIKTTDFEEQSGRHSSKSKGSSSGKNEIMDMTLPEIPKFTTQLSTYSNISANFEDGMLLSLSSSTGNVKDESQSAILQVISSIAKEISEVVSQTSSSAAPALKSPKGKRGKKEDELKIQEELERQQQKEEFMKQLTQRKKEIVDAVCENERKKNLYVTTPDGLHVSFHHDLIIEDFEQLESAEKSFYLKQYRLTNTLPEETLESLDKVDEKYQCITDAGHVVKFMSDNTVAIFTSTGEICRSSPYNKNNFSFVLENADNPATPTYTNKPEVNDFGEFVTSIKVDWHVIKSTGHQFIIKVDGTVEHLDTLMIANATCFHTAQILQTREDGTISVLYPDGKKVVEYSDGTRFTSFNNENNISINSETGEENVSKETNPLILIEAPSYASVCIDETNNKMTVSYGNNKEISAFKDGRYIVCKDGIMQLLIDEKGSASIYPPSSSVNRHSSENFIQSGVHNSVVLKQSAKDCLCFVDGSGNKFTVNNLGEYTVEKSSSEELNGVEISPRFFVVYPDGSGEELLRHVDVVGYLQEASVDPESAVICTDVENDCDAEAITVIKPFKRIPKKLWQPKKRVSNIIPIGLRERDFKTFPVDLFSSNTTFGTRIGMKQEKQSKSVGEALEIRHLIKYKELTSDVRESIIEGISKFGEFVQQQRQSSEVLIEKDERTPEEKEIAEQIKQRYYHEQSARQEDTKDIIERAEEEITEQYLTAIKPPSPPPAPQAKPERAASEWEKDKIELAEFKHAKKLLRSREFPPYFDTEEGQAFLYENGILPDMSKLTANLAHETKYPKEKVISVPSTPTESSHELTNENIGPSFVTPVANSTPQLNESSYSIHSSSLSMKFDASANTISPYMSSIDGSHLAGRPMNPTPKQASNATVSTDAIDMSEDSKLATIPEIATQSTNQSTGLDYSAYIKSLSYDPSSKMRIKTPTSILGSRPNALPNDRFSVVEEPVRRQVKTASISGAINPEVTAKIRGFVLLPDLVDFGVLKEGCTYSYPVTMKNVGIDSCRFKITQPPPSTGLKVLFQPGSVAAGMSVSLSIEIFAVAVGVEGSCGIGQVSHLIEIVTETDVIYLPVIATGIYMFKVNNGTIKTKWEIYSKVNNKETRTTSVTSL